MTIAIAHAWIKRFEQVVPKSTPRARISLAWHLARRGIASDEALRKLPDLKPVPGSLGQAGIDLAKEYLKRLS